MTGARGGEAPDLTHYGSGRSWVRLRDRWVHVRVWMHEAWECDVSWRVGHRWA